MPKTPTKVDFLGRPDLAAQMQEINAAQNDAERRWIEAVIGIAESQVAHGVNPMEVFKRMRRMVEIKYNLLSGNSP